MEAQTDFVAIGARISAAMRARGGVKATALAHQIGVSESAISRWRRGAPLTLSNAVALSAALDASLDWLLLGRGFMDAPPRGAGADPALAEIDPEALAKVAEILRRAADDRAAPGCRNARPGSDLAQGASLTIRLARGART